MVYPVLLDLFSRLLNSDKFYSVNGPSGNDTRVVLIRVTKQAMDSRAGR